MSTSNSSSIGRRKSILAALRRRERSGKPFGGTTETVCFPTPTLAELAAETGYCIASVQRTLRELEGVEITRGARKGWGRHGRRSIVFLKRAHEHLVLVCGCTITEVHRAHAAACPESWWGVPVYP